MTSRPTFRNTRASTILIGSSRDNNLRRNTLPSRGTSSVSQSDELQTNAILAHLESEENQPIGIDNMETKSSQPNTLNEIGDVLYLNESEQQKWSTKERSPTPSSETKIQTLNQQPIIQNERNLYVSISDFPKPENETPIEEEILYINSNETLPLKKTVSVERIRVPEPQPQLEPEPSLYNATVMYNNQNTDFSSPQLEEKIHHPSAFTSSQHEALLRNAYATTPDAVHKAHRAKTESSHHHHTVEHKNETCYEQLYSEGRSSTSVPIIQNLYIRQDEIKPKPKKVEDFAPLYEEDSKNNPEISYTSEPVKPPPLKPLKIKPVKKTQLHRGESSAAIAQHNFKTRDWNELHQVLMETRFTKETIMKKDGFRNVDWSTATALAREFGETATLYAKIIISEICLPPDLKSIKPIDVGGIAGGQKFKVQNIIFKFALDTLIFENTDYQVWMYGATNGPDDESAIKAAKNELKGLEAHSSTHTPGLCYPMMALIDYKGFRIIAMSQLPIDKSTIKYGSNDSGMTVHDDIPELNEKMKEVAEVLNLKGHNTGIRTDAKKFVYGPGDIEGHLGLDGRFYVLDFGRVLPPEDPDIRKEGNSRSVFYQLLRPQLVQSNKVPLCSDAFTNWNSDNDLEKRKEHNAEVTEATKRIYDDLVPRTAKDLDNLDLNWDKLYSSPTVDEIRNALDRVGPIGLHYRGLNMRHLGFIRSHCKSPEARKLLLSVCIARIAKDDLRERMREKMREVSVPSDQPFKKVVVKLLNMIRGGSKESNMYWEQDIKRGLARKFKVCLTPEEQSDTFDLKKVIDLRLVFSFLFDSTGVKIMWTALQQLMTMNENFKFVDADIKSIDSKTKYKSDIYLSGSMALLMKSMRKSEKIENQEELVRELIVSEAGFRKSYNASPTCPFTLYGWGSSLLELAKIRCTTAESEETFKNIYEKMELSLLSFPDFPMTLKTYAEAERHHAKLLRQSGDTARAEQLEKNAWEKDIRIPANPDFIPNCGAVKAW